MIILVTLEQLSWLFNESDNKKLEQFLHIVKYYSSKSFLQNVRLKAQTLCSCLKLNFNF